MAPHARKPAGITEPEQSAQQIHRAFRRMAFILANLVCGIWLVLVISMAIVDEDRPTGVAIALMLTVTTPLAYLLPYGLVRAMGFVVVLMRQRPR